MKDLRIACLLPLLMFAATGCQGHDAGPPPPPARSFEGLPVMGSLADAQAAGFIACLADVRSMRCRKDAVMLAGTGPYAAAVDLKGNDGAGGFDHLTLWHESDQGAILAVGDALKKAGWHSCLKGEQEDYTQPGSPARIAIDASYWGKRRVVIDYEAGGAKPRC